MLIRLPKVLEATGLSRSSVYNRISQGTFPRPVRTGPRTVAWVSEEINEWIRLTVAASRAPQAWLK
jgi:prophage regulatory protein